MIYLPFYVADFELKKSLIEDFILFKNRVQMPDKSRHRGEAFNLLHMSFPLVNSLNLVLYIIREEPFDVIVMLIPGKLEDGLDVF